MARDPHGGATTSSRGVVTRAPAARKDGAGPRRGAAVVVRPVTPEVWTDFERLFSARGAPHYWV
jgi:hypothetical protein